MAVRYEKGVLKSLDPEFDDCAECFANLIEGDEVIFVIDENMGCVMDILCSEVCREKYIEDDLD